MKDRGAASRRSPVGSSGAASTRARAPRGPTSEPPGVLGARSSAGSRVGSAETRSTHLEPSALARPLLRPELARRRPRSRSSRPASRSSRSAASACGRGAAPAKRTSTAPRPPLQRTSKPLCSSGARETATSARPSSSASASLADGGGARGRERMQAHRHLDDRAERAERAREQLGEVIARHVLDHLAAALRERAVGERDAHADHEVAHAAVAAAQRARVAAGHDAAERGAVVRGVEREHLALLGERRLRLARAARRPRARR